MEHQMMKGTIIEQMMRTMHLIKEKVGDGHKARQKQIAVLHYIYSCPEHKTTISNLARHYQITDAAASQMVTYFEKHGWVDKVRTKFDRRIVYVQVSQTFIEEMKEKFNEMTEKVNQYLTFLGPKDAIAFERILNKTIEYLEERGDRA